MAEFDTTNTVYREAIDTLARVAMSDAWPEPEREKQQERAYGICIGIATMLIPGVYQTSQAPPVEIADAVAQQVLDDMTARVKELPDG
jgi:hypothetical protein